MDSSRSISAEFPFESRYLEVEGSRIHYIDEGAGDPILFLHGNPTSSYLWRNIIPHLSDNYRCIAPDLIGMGKSDKPDIRSRRPIHRWPNEIPIDGKPADVHQAVTDFSAWVTQTELPKLLFYADPGGIIREKQIDWCRTKMKNLSTIDIGPGIHYLQEDNLHLIGEELARWLNRLTDPGVT